MTILFVRHADAEPDTAGDAVRELSDKGRAQAKRLGTFLRRGGMVPGIILTSPLVRARQTAVILGRELAAELAEAPFLAPGNDPVAMLRELGAWSRMEGVMAVGHEPEISACIESLIGVKRGLGVRMRKACIAAVECELPEPGAGELQYLVPVRLMP